MVATISRAPNQRLTGQVDISCGAEFPTDILDIGGMGFRRSRGVVRQNYSIEVNFDPIAIGDPQVSQAVHLHLQQLMMDRNYPEFLRSLAAALEGGDMPDPSMDVKPKRKRKAKKKKVEPPPKPPRPKRNIRFLERG
jgi:hypothetical protein